MNLKVKPELRDILESFKQEIFYDFNCVRIGIISSFDAVNQSAEVQIVDKKTKEDAFGKKEHYDIPLLIKCPVLINKGKDGGITFPIKKGDTCIVLFNDRDIDNWFKNGQVQPPKSKRAHNLSDGLVLVGIRSLQNKISNYNNDASEINYQNTKISLDAKVGISNAAKDLKTLVDSLFSTLVSMTIQDPVSGPIPLTSSSQSALNSLKAEFQQLLKSN